MMHPTGDYETGRSICQHVVELSRCLRPFLPYLIFLMRWVVLLDVADSSWLALTKEDFP